MPTLGLHPVFFLFMTNVLLWLGLEVEFQPFFWVTRVLRGLKTGILVPMIY